MVSGKFAKAERYVVLDGMRGVAALAVVTDHIDSPLLSAALSGRYLAVDFFFVLSGFVLSHVYAGRLAAGMSLADFMRVRVIRLYPLYLIGLLAGAAFTAMLALKGWSDAPWTSILAATGLGLLMLPAPTALSPSPYNIYPFDGPAWSLFFELFINAVFALIFARLSLRVLGAILAVSAVALVASGFHYGALSGGYDWETFLGGFPRVFYGFFAGVLVHRLHAGRALPALPAWAAFVALLAILATPATGAARVVFDLAAALILFPVLVAAAANSRVDGAQAKVAAWLGMLSYGVYILHVPIRDWLDLALAALTPGLEVPGLVMAVLVAGAAIVATAVLHVMYDLPARRWLSGRRAPRPA